MNGRVRITIKRPYKSNRLSHTKESNICSCLGDLLSLSSNENISKEQFYIGLSKDD